MSTSLGEAVFQAISKNDYIAIERKLEEASVAEATVCMITRDADELTPVQAACLRDQRRVIRTLVDVGADLTSPCLHGKGTLAHIAAVNGSTQLFSLLSSLGVDWETLADSSLGFTPAHVAAQLGHAELLQSLIDTLGSGAVCFARDKRGTTTKTPTRTHTV